MEWQLRTKFDCRIFTTGGSFEVGDVVVDTFTIPHDASDPVGFSAPYQLRATSAS